MMKVAVLGSALRNIATAWHLCEVGNEFNFCETRQDRWRHRSLRGE
jgi:hypothetical protein